MWLYKRILFDIHKPIFVYSIFIQVDGRKTKTGRGPSKNPKDGRTELEQPYHGGTGSLALEFSMFHDMELWDPYKWPKING